MYADSNLLNYEGMVPVQSLYNSLVPVIQGSVTICKVLKCSLHESWRFKPSIPWMALFCHLKTNSELAEFPQKKIP